MAWALPIETDNTPLVDGLLEMLGQPDGKQKDLHYLLTGEVLYYFHRWYGSPSVLHTKCHESQRGIHRGLSK